MKELFLLTIIAFGFISCDQQETSNVDKISTDFWKTRKKIRDSILLISISRQTPNYIFYSVKTSGKPVRVSPGSEDSYERVNETTLFWNKGQKISRDYEFLLKDGSIVLHELTGIDDRFKGSIYIFRANNNGDEFRRLLLIDFFELLKHKTPPQAMTSAEENIYYDETASYIWNW
jgi:hypothetical protein